MSAASTSTGHGHTFWCHECDMSITLLCPSPSSSTLVCPHCHTNFLEHMDIPYIDPIATASSPGDDSNMLDSPHLQALISQLSTDTESLNPHAASKASINSLPTIKITASSLELDCAICKDEFVVDAEAMKLPCEHFYHPDCILPWLRQQNSCPLCRFCFPTEAEDPPRRMSRTVAEVVQVMRFEDEDLYGLRGTLRIIARRHGIDLSEIGISSHREEEGEVMGRRSSGLEEMVFGELEGSSLEDAAEVVLSDFGM